MDSNGFSLPVSSNLGVERATMKVRCRDDDLIDYYLVRFKDEEDYSKVLTEGPWIIYVQYLTVQPWSPTFSTDKVYPRRVMVIMIDYNTDSGSRGRFARMTISIDLSAPLISKIMIDGNLQRVEYKRLPTVSFGCGHYGHIQDICLHKMNAEVNDEPAERNASPTADLHRRVEEENFGSWMIVERKNRRKSNNGQDKKLGNHGVNEGGSRISVLDREQDMEIHSTNEDGVNKRICY
ncbi:hypothetical protein Goklo_022217 [Gossypium klotzschianum]|uniref:DUF4283 domain-containing protein n=1 Tax=Gossypium klotzschianum TaxID=34286 RepID=A0A7J8TLQ3_9ROSI|nr:hypothetical protein [Gossypium klotzschianum]